MASSDRSHDIYLEVGQKKAFAVAANWPGWCRFGRDEEAAVQKLMDAAPRYAKIAQSANLEFTLPETISQLNTLARLEGNTTTDFGAPAIPLPNDWDTIEADELVQCVKLLRACWLAFDEAVAQATGEELRKGPRGGGRSLAKLIDHVVGAEEGYLKSLGWKLDSIEMETIEEHRDRVRSEVIQGLYAAADGQLPRVGPRGGQRWAPRYFARRLAWHVVDHAWEIEDRMS